MKIILNAVKCLICGEVVESTHVHDYVTCGCGNVSVDGGHEYLRRAISDEDSVLELSEVEHELH